MSHLCIHFTHLFINFLLQDDNVYAHYYDPVELGTQENITVGSYYNDDDKKYYNGVN